MQMNDKQEQLLALADELGVDPSEFANLYRQRPWVACSEIDQRYTIEHAQYCGIGVKLTMRFDGAHRAHMSINPKTAIRWGESLAAAGRECTEVKCDHPHDTYCSKCNLPGVTASIVRANDGRIKVLISRGNDVAATVYLKLDDAQGFANGSLELVRSK